MKKFAVAMLVVALAGCTDAERARLGTYGSEAAIKCYSGGQEIFSDVSTGKVVSLDGDGFAYKSKKTGRYVRAFADCILTDTNG